MNCPSKIEALTQLIYPWGMVAPKPKLDLEAEVECKTKHRHWVAWDDRHLGKDPTADGYTRAKCRACPTGNDATRYSGRFREKGGNSGN